MACLQAGNIGVEVFQSESKLVAIDPFRAPSELRALESLNDELEPLDLGLRLGKLGSIARHLRSQVTHQLVQLIDIRRQRGEDDDHPESISRSENRTLLHAQPATAGRHRRSGARQSTPSISIDSCSELSATVSPGSTSGGHRKTPCSSRLVKRHRPVPSQYTIMIRLALRPRNTNRWPENGSCRNTACTNMASPSTPLRISVYPRAKCTFRPRGTSVMLMAHAPR